MGHPRIGFGSSRMLSVNFRLGKSALDADMHGSGIYLGARGRRDSIIFLSSHFCGRKLVSSCRKLRMGKGSNLYLMVGVSC